MPSRLHVSLICLCTLLQWETDLLTYIHGIVCAVVYTVPVLSLSVLLFPV